MARDGMQTTMTVQTGKRNKLMAIALDVSGDSVWVDYFVGRFMQFCKHVCDTSPEKRKLTRAMILAGIEQPASDFQSASPEAPLLASRPSTVTGWQFRPDTFTEAAIHLTEIACGSENLSLFCLSKLARPEDEWLKSQNHIVVRGNVLLTEELSSRNLQAIARICRHTRPLGMLGVVAPSNDDFCRNPAKLLFVTDVFQGDAIGVGEFILQAPNARNR